MALALLVAGQKHPITAPLLLMPSNTNNLSMAQFANEYTLKRILWGSFQRTYALAILDNVATRANIN